MNQAELNDLEREYRAAIYTVRAGEREIRFRIGENSEKINRLLGERGAARFAQITAYNPRSETLEDAENEDRQENLRKVLRDSKFEFLESYNEDENGQHRERSFFILEVSPEKAVEIGKQFEQNAIVCGEKNREIKLLWCLTN